MLRLSKKLTLMLMSSAVMLISGQTMQVVAQTTNSPWTTPVNLSQSGGASQPLIAVSSDGTLHVLWWDAVRGEQYARTTSITSTTWTQTVDVPSIIGARSLDAVSGRANLIAPDRLQILAVARNNAHALWYNALGSLQTAQFTGVNWSSIITLTQSPAAMAATADVSGTLHLAYLKRSDDVDGPAGVYYRANAGARWTASALVYDSLYFRTAAAQNLQISVAGVDQNVLVAWDDPQLSQSQYARSIDGGRAWSEPQMITSTQSGRTRRAQVASAPNGDLLLMWQDTSLNGCGWLQRRSSDGGSTWSDPQRMLSNLTRCEERFTFSSANGQLWLVGRVITDRTSDQAGDTVNTVTLAAWDGRAWSAPMDVSLSILDTVNNRTLNLNCLNLSVASQMAGVIGCDSNGDVWSARSSIALKDLSTALKSVWSPLEVISNRTSPVAAEGTLATTADRKGNVYALWSQAAAGNTTSIGLYGSQLINQRWTPPTMLLNASGAANNNEARAGHPALTADDRDRIHAVWNGGTTGSIYYAWAYSRDFNTATGWSNPVAVPQIASTTSWPDVAIGSDDDTVYVIYAAPFNEKRGIYFTRSGDGGTTWLTSTLVFDAIAAHWESAEKPRLVFDPGANMLHAIWLRVNLPNSLSPRGVYYARSTDSGQTWSQALALTAGRVDWPRLALNGPGNLVAAWTETTAPDQADASTPLSIVSAASNDGGLQWTSPDRVRGFERVSGPSDLVSDHSGKLYLGAVGQTASGESTLLYAEWAAQGWSRSESLTLNQNAVMGNSTAMALAPETGNLAVLLRLWVFNQQNHGSFQIAAVSRGVQRSSSAPAPTFTPQPTVTPQPTATPEPTATPRPQLPDNAQLPEITRPGSNPLVIGGALAAAIVVAMFAVVVWRQRR